MKARYVLWPVMVFGAVSLASACGGGGSSSEPDTTVGGSDGEGGSGTNVGASSNTGNTDAGGMSTTDAGASSGGIGAASTGGASAGTGGAGGAVSGDLCEGKDLDCEDDDNPCTEDECNPATGECGIPRSETSCDDGVWCNGADTCDAGECTVHEGTSCSGTCNEAGEYCECSTKADCPDDVLGEWSECAYATECVETAMRNRTVTKYSCNGVGKCIAGAPTIESDSAGCVRETDTVACTDNLNRCDGLELCKNGNCVPQGATADPCKNNAANPYCYNSDPTCRVCKSANFNGSNPTGCSSGQFCCAGVCKATSCITIVTSLVTTASIATFAQ